MCLMRDPPVSQVGPEVRHLKPGDRAVACFDLGCSRCSYCKHGMFSSCDNTNPRYAGLSCPCSEQLCT